MQQTDAKAAAPAATDAKAPAAAPAPAVGAGLVKAPIDAVADRKGDELMDQAKKKLNSFTPLGFGKKAKMQEAAEIYEKAGKQYKLAKNFDSAAQAFILSGDLYKQLKMDMDAAPQYTAAGSAFQSAHNNKEAARVWELAAPIYQANERFSSVSRIYSDMGDMYAADEDWGNACDALKLAADFSTAADEPTNATKSLEKIAHFRANMGQYDEAVKLFEELAERVASNNLISWASKDHCFKAMLCRLLKMATQQSQEIGGAREGLAQCKAALQKYMHMYPKLENTREQAVLEAIMNAYEAMDVQAFATAVYEYDRICKLDDWKTKRLLTLRKAIEKTTAQPTVDLR